MCNAHPFLTKVGEILAIVPFALSLSRTFVNKGVSDNAPLGNVKLLEERNRQLEKKLAEVKVDLVNTVEENEVTINSNEKIVTNLQAKIDALEDRLESKEEDIKTLEKVIYSKNEIIKKLDYGFNK